MSFEMGGEKTPYGPWHDYSRQLGGAEDAVGTVIENILMDGGTILWQKYLERKAFAFAAEAATEAVVSQLTMCFVAHDKGEDIAGDMEEWTLEAEPEPGEVDSWARMHLPVRRQARGEDAAASASTTRQARAAESKRMAKSRTGGFDKGGRSAKGAAKTEKVEPRATPIQQEPIVDEEEERLRDQKFQEEMRRREKERKAKEAEKQKDEERKTVIALHEEMARKAHTFDTEGKIIWVEEIKADKLPKVTETMVHNIKKDPRQLRTESGSTTRNAMAPPEAPAANPTGAPAGQRGNRRPQRPQRGNRKTKPDDSGETEFTDGFSKLQHGQPPILETMNVQPGVTLESMGKKKAGADLPAGNHRQMSRKEYVMLAQQEVAMDMQFHSDGSSPSKQPVDARGDESVEAPGKAEVAAEPSYRSASKTKEMAPGGAAPAASVPAQEAVTAPSGSAALLPPLQQPNGQRGNAAAQRPGVSGGLQPGPQRGAGSVAGGGASGGGGGQEAPVQTAPRAPAMSTRAKRFEAVGNLGRPPRYHMPLLGGPSGYGAPQPPLGATMGHGLIRHGSLKETYFFPAQTPDLPGGMFRSTSEVTFSSARRTQQTSMVSSKRGGRSAGARSSKPSSREASQQSAEKGPLAAASAELEEEGGVDGRLRPEASMAYRNFRSALFPNEPMRM